METLFQLPSSTPQALHNVLIVPEVAEGLKATLETEKFPELKFAFNPLVPPIQIEVGDAEGEKLFAGKTPTANV